ncbi:MAG TPA: DUF6056 family protein [Flavobacteriales bacterium]|nr:DUF6056 family protein [Flavobacteriales bacterium]HMR26079.1 DUF6056 family protein [Flavobacteriales bacterium]
MLLLLIARHVLLAFACAPYGDDWGYAAMGMRSDPLERLVHEHHTWNGRYFSNALVLFGPLTLGLGIGLPLYRAVPVVLLVLATAAMAWLLAAWPKLIPRRSDRWAFAAAFTLLHLHAMPHLGEGLYWYTGAVTYHGAWLLLLVHAGALIRMEGAGPRRLQVPIAIGSLVAAAGCNETAMVLLVCGHAGWTLADLVNTRTAPFRRWGMLAMAVGCGLFVTLAPGNAVRSMHFDHRHDVLLTLGMGGVQAARFALTWLSDPVVVCALFLAWWAGRTRATAPGAFQRPTPWLIAAALALGVGTLLPYWTMGMLGQHRTLNFVLGPFLLCMNGAALALGQRGRRQRTPAWLTSGRTTLTALCLGSIGLLAWGNDRWVTQDLVSGDAWRFRRHTAGLHAVIASASRSGSAVAMVPVFPDALRSLRIPEPTADPDAYWNRTLAGYFGGDAFRVVAVDATALPPGAPH